MFQEATVDYRVFEFPTINDGIKPVEEKFCELVQKYRDHSLNPEELDYLDWANNALIEARGNH